MAWRCLGGKKMDEQGRRWGAFYSWEDVGRGLGFLKRNNDRAAREDAVLRQGSYPRLKEGLMGGVTPSAKRRRGSSVPLQRREKLGRGPFSGSGRNNAPGLFSFFCSFLFPFTILYFFYNFCKIVSNPLKPIPKIL
jgi:hypothetical protein